MAQIPRSKIASFYKTIRYKTIIDKNQLLATLEENNLENSSFYKKIKKDTKTNYGRNQLNKILLEHILFI